MEHVTWLCKNNAVHFLFGKTMFSEKAASDLVDCINYHMRKKIAKFIPDTERTIFSIKMDERVIEEHSMLLRFTLCISATENLYVELTDLGYMRYTVQAIVRTTSMAIFN